MTGNFLDCPIFNGIEAILPVSTESPVRRRLFFWIGILSLICAFIGITTLASPTPTASQGVSLLQILGLPTREIFFTPTTSMPVTATDQPKALEISERSAPATSVQTPTDARNLGFPVVIRQSTVTARPTSTFTPTPTLTATPLILEKKRSKTPSFVPAFYWPTPRPPKPARTLETLPPPYRPTAAPPPIR